MHNSKLNSSIFHFIILTFVFVKPGQGRANLCKALTIRGKSQIICQAICDENCVDGICDYVPKRCICNKGYHPEQNKCQPDCAAGCPSNATCISGSNNCYCNKGYETNDLGQCSPHCEEDCDERSYCAAPNACHCKMGYEQTNDGCQPICAEGCAEHAHCATPNTCTCDAGYQPMADASDKCQPICDVTRCGGNATCLRPGICECAAGYARRNDSIDCLPHCLDGCGPNSACIAPDHCECVEGYLRIGDACRPKCTNACGINAHCALPEVCQCRAGFENKAIVGFEQSCQPICSVACPLHAYCASPNHCRCIAGYTLVGTNCVPYCKDGCGKHSSCIMPDTCNCNIGYLDQDGECVNAAQLQKCLKEMKMLLFSVHVSCDTSSFVIYLIYGALIGLLLACTLITYKGVQLLRHKSTKRSGNHTQPPTNYIITYQPHSGESGQAVTNDECDMASASYSQPPAYNALTMKC
ncbi:von Willebrand factor D and EGF domain-containing protein-like [Anastrepha obliqua]|uniref:von Willebrand factor D and EGF domain-containing protein-like n=1 Tax=Anastrepha obliqua TaxID=95512 RepID=UPI0024096D34|nr:von Willebrand factor D and EGF domain-containing protein-like [Anastrepha obliqua]